jgi:peroxiredoxin
MCTFQEDLKSFNDLDATVLGISVDSPWANGSFANKYNLEFDLLSDFDRSVIKSYDVVFEGLGGIEGYTCANRAVFIVKDRTIMYKWIAPSPGEEPNYEEVKSKLKEL